MNRVVALDESVLKEILTDFTLFTVFTAVVPSYDPDIDPLHNQDFVRSSKKKEQEVLETIKSKIIPESKGLWNELRDIHL